jgi:hypothetical protein
MLKCANIDCLISGEGPKLERSTRKLQQLLSLSYASRRFRGWFTGSSQVGAEQLPRRLCQPLAQLH